MLHHRKYLGLARIAGVFCIVMSAGISQARDRGQYSLVPQSIRNWINDLTDDKGIPCCATADGTAPQDFTWDIAANRYRVKIDGEWLDVPDSAVIKGPNRVGHAIVWVDYDDPIYDLKPIISVRCFLPGPGV
jgi:hypothetical protein